MNSNEYAEQLLEKQKAYLNIDKYHKQGYKGKGITILNNESYPGKEEHGEMTAMTILDFAPQVNAITCPIQGASSGNKVKDAYITMNNEKIDLEKAIDKFNIKLITSSNSKGNSEPWLNYFKDLQKRKGIIMCSAAGNKSDKGVTGTYTRDNTSIAVGAVQFVNNKVKITEYSAVGEELDFVSFTGKYIGTSFSSPCLTAMIALLLNKYGDFNQVECYEILKSLCIDLGDIGFDMSYGYGLPVLPLAERLQKLDELRSSSIIPEKEKNMNFTDVNETDWYYKDIQKAVSNGLLKGYDDETFKPNNNITRAEVAVIVNRILEKIKNI